jgi:hypothetical protein
MRNETPDKGDQSPVGLEGLARWRASLRERINYLTLDAGVGMALTGYQAAQTPDAKVTLLITSVVVLLTVVDLLFKWKRRPLLPLTIVIYVGLVAMLVSGFFTGIGILWAIANGVVFFFWAGMYESTRLVLEERPVA